MTTFDRYPESGGKTIAVSDPTAGAYDPEDRLLESEPEVWPDYPLSDCARDTGLDAELLARWVRAIERKGQAILYGPPGTGKTFVAQHLARHLVANGTGTLELVQFHPAYAYEDFVLGIRPVTTNGSLSYEPQAGRFVAFCEEARRRAGICVLIIDEINRANLAQVFGELMYLMEYRDRSVPLAGGKEFAVPGNVRIIGTMNTADRSIALMDYALRRRFAFLRLDPNYDLLANFHADSGYPVDGLVTLLKQVNMSIGDPNYHLGISFFLRPDLALHVEDIWRMEIEPYLEEFFFDDLGKIASYRWEAVGTTLIP
jgi:5-methylcytosine-specific restriction protein B